MRPRLTAEGQQFTDNRLYLNLRVQDVAQDLGVNQGRISEAEIGEKPVKEEILNAIRAYYAQRRSQ